MGRAGLRQSFSRSYARIFIADAPCSVKINPVPFLFLPAFIVISVMLDGWWSLAWGLGAWGVVVLVGTLTHAIRVMQRQTEDDELSKFVERASSVLVE